jgi:Tfp pilus assembly protein PilE
MKTVTADWTMAYRGQSAEVFTLLNLLYFVAILGVLMCLLFPATRRGSHEAARRNNCAAMLHQIGIALHEYAKVHGALPPAYTVDADGESLHSWRTLILPYIG